MVARRGVKTYSELMTPAVNNVCTRVCPFERLFIRKIIPFTVPYGERRRRVNIVAEIT